MNRRTIGFGALVGLFIAVIAFVVLSILPIAQPKATAQADPTVRPADPNAVEIMKDPNDMPMPIMNGH